MTIIRLLSPATINIVSAVAGFLVFQLFDAVSLLSVASGVTVGVILWMLLRLRTSKQRDDITRMESEADFSSVGSRKTISWDKIDSVRVDAQKIWVNSGKSMYAGELTERDGLDFSKMIGPGGERKLSFGSYSADTHLRGRFPAAVLAVSGISLSASFLVFTSVPLPFPLVFGGLALALGSVVGFGLLNPRLLPIPSWACYGTVSAMALGALASMFYASFVTFMTFAITIIAATIIAERILRRSLQKSYP